MTGQTEHLVLRVAAQCEQGNTLIDLKLTGQRTYVNMCTYIKMYHLGAGCQAGLGCLPLSSAAVNRLQVSSSWHNGSTKEGSVQYGCSRCDSTGTMLLS